MRLRVEQVHEWRGQDVLDRDGERIGKLDEVYYDSADGEPRFISVKSGLLGRQNHLVALAGATVSRDHIQVAYPQADIQRVETGERQGQLDAATIRDAADTYAAAVNPDARFESASLLSERQADADHAAEHARELEHEATRRAQQADTSLGRAQDAAQESRRAEQDRDDARQAAIEARRDAQQAARDVPPAN